MAELKLSNVNKSYGSVKVLHDVELDIKDGEFVVFVGPSGCGKSTLLRVIAGLEEVTSGAIAIGARDVSALSPAERKIAMVFQSYALYPHMSVRKNLAFGLENLKFKRAEIEARIAEAARMLAIEPYLDRRPKQLSGGQRQRVAIGRAIVREPDIFLFDEPLSNLDAALRVQTRAEITKLHRDIKTTMIYVTHDQVEAMTMADKIVVLRAGRVEQVGAPLDLFDSPRNLFVAGFLGSPRMNIIKGKVSGVSESGVVIDVGNGGSIVSDVDLAGIAVGQAVLAGIRPAHFSRSSEQGLPFIVQYHEGLGTETYVYGNLAGQDEQIIIHEAGHFAPAPGDPILIDAAPGRVHLFDPENGLAFARRPGQGRR
ncbi:MULTISPECIES: ABC transporter ATP-binding protein [Rhizobium]|uniref:ABC transporter ATP-binding protein n=1 Tax=Rhizobium TaxID=379 RepID=UPI0014421A9C|nr:MULTISPECIES: sn-glycerol-3-phosphate ABC transporter ATP-binding protein UgpC [Rhizobium]MDU0306050.1 sn-glycerol-3-phosphate ABC transporter ATP-binding protein UgpC [Rhizobium sp. 10PS4]NKM23280.1 sn-glycerol-3-phosphate ABC transporter ATP-binding protein UgpC [Rhizobium laguerreae]